MTESRKTQLANVAAGRCEQCGGGKRSSGRLCAKCKSKHRAANRRWSKGRRRGTAPQTPTPAQVKHRVKTVLQIAEAVSLRKRGRAVPVIAALMGLSTQRVYQLVAMAKRPAA